MSVHHRTWAALFPVLLVGTTGQRLEASSEAERPLACSTFLNEELGTYRTQISTTSAEAQRLFDQGLMLSYAFNHEEAEHSFRAAIEHDPACAMCYWGLAYVQGPNTNAKRSAERGPIAYEASQKALALAGRATPRERGWIDALTRRYAEHPPADRAPLDRAYAEAMAEVANRFPDDLDTWALYAEALMDTSPWNYWGERGQATSLTVQILSALTRVLKKAPY